MYEELSGSRKVLSTEAVGRITPCRDPLNSSYPTKAEFINCFIIYHNIFKHLKEKMSFIFTNFTPSSNILTAKVILYKISPSEI